MCEHCHEEEYNAVILNLEDQDLECGVITIFEMDGQDYIALFPMDENRKSNTSMIKLNCTPHQTASMNGWMSRSF